MTREQWLALKVGDTIIDRQCNYVRRRVLTVRRNSGKPEQRGNTRTTITVPNLTSPSRVTTLFSTDDVGGGKRFDLGEPMPDVIDRYDHEETPHPFMRTDSLEPPSLESVRAKAREDAEIRVSALLQAFAMPSVGEDQIRALLVDTIANTHTAGFANGWDEALDAVAGTVERAFRFRPRDR
jgi:hypothetical protein